MVKKKILKNVQDVSRERVITLQVIKYICNYKNICYNIIAQNDQGMKIPFVVVLIKISVSDGQRFNILSVLGDSLCQPLQTRHI